MSALPEPNQRGADSTRDRILAAAALVLSQRGIAEARLTEIASIAQVKSPAVYYHFGSRDEVIAEVLRVGQQRVREHVETALADLPPTATSLDRITAACAAHLRIQMALADFAGAVSRNAAHAAGPLHDELHAESERYHAVWRRLIEDGLAAGELRPDLDPSTARMLVIGALNWTTEWFPRGRSSDDLVSQASALVERALANH